MLVVGLVVALDVANKNLGGDVGRLLFLFLFLFFFLLLLAALACDNAINCARISADGSANIEE